MKKLKIISLTLLCFLVCLIIAGCGTKKTAKPSYTSYKGMKIYPVKVTSIGESRTMNLSLRELQKLPKEQKFW